MQWTCITTRRSSITSRNNMLQKQVSAPVVCIKLTGWLYFLSLLRLNDNAFYNPPTNFRALLSATLRHVVQNRPTITRNI